LLIAKETAEGRLEEAETDLNPEVLAFDFPGVISLAIWISSLLTVIDLRNQLSWEQPLVLAGIIVGSLSFLTFLTVETYPGNRQLLIPLRLLKTEIGAFCATQVSRALSTAFPPAICYYSHRSQGPYNS
jgi:hypothetical protein